jgi:hypothetical protein
VGPIKTGAILIREGAILPETLRVEGEPFAYSWRLIKNLDGYGLDRKIREMGWSLTRMAGQTKALAVGFGEQETIGKALKRGLARLQSTRCNCLEISQVTSKRIAGVFQAMVLIYPRNIQNELQQKHGDLPLK